MIIAHVLQSALIKPNRSINIEGLKFGFLGDKLSLIVNDWDLKFRQEPHAVEILPCISLTYIFADPGFDRLISSKTVGYWMHKVEMQSC